MSKYFTLFYLLLLIPSAIAEKKSHSIPKFVENMYQATTEGLALPHLSMYIKEPTNQQSSTVQHLLVQKLVNGGLNISGYKAGLTSIAGQKKFAVTSPISGVMFAQGEVNNKTVGLSDYRKLMLETEIGFVLNTDIDKPVEDIQQLKTKISAVMPVIEMPNLAFANLKQVSGQDIIASNAISNRYLLGAPLSLPLSFDLKQVEIQLSLASNGVNLIENKGFGRDVLGGQWTALLWLVNDRLESGYHLSKGQFLITGALGKMVPAKTGQYRANYGKLGIIDFQITN